MIEKRVDLKTFVEVIRNKIPSNNNFQIFNETVNYYDMSLGGCGCSRKTREKYADDKFVEKINNLNPNILTEIKAVFELSGEDTLIFVNKDDGLIKKV